MPLLRIGCVLQLLGLLSSGVFVVSEGLTLTLTPDQGTTFNISRTEDAGSKCTVCTGKGGGRKCLASVMLTNSVATPVEFTCPKPQEVFTVEVSRDIECTTKSCTGNTIQNDAGSLPLLDFNRTFTWNLKAPGPRAFRLDFTQTGLRQVRPSEVCPDQYTYTLQAFQQTGRVAIGTYCRQGAISGAQVLNQGRVSQEVPAGRRLNPVWFDVSLGEEIKSLAVITVTLPEGTSSSELFSPNYPDSFPDDDLLEWQFVVPPIHNATVAFVGHTKPQCVKKEPGVEYHSRSGGATTVVKLADLQPAQFQDSFSLSLRNCEMKRATAGSPGLSLHLRVSTIRTRVLCSVDLRSESGLSLYIEKTSSRSKCQLKLNSVVQEKITVSSGKISELSFQDCSRHDLLLTASKTIECRQLKDCPTAPVSLTVPVLKCLPVPLSNVTWTLSPPQHGAVELLPPAGNMRQSLPGQTCNGTVTLSIVEGDGTTVGQFCNQDKGGAISKVQVRTNVSITATTMGDNVLRPASRHLSPLLNIAFSEEIAENYIFTVCPKKGVPVFLATPSWPASMKSYSTVSWIVFVPDKLEAHLMFINVSQPKCSNRHAHIRVQNLGSEEEMYSRREDEMAASELTSSDSFYLNMSNCMPESGAFSVVTQITLHKDKNRLLTIILSVVSALLVLMVAVLAVVCVVIRKKKRQLTHQVSIYNPNGTSFLPSNNRFPKSREDNESHIYASIEDTMVYGHLLQDDPAVDVYRTFTGPTEGLEPLFSGPEVGVYQPFRPQSQLGPPVPNRPAGQGQGLGQPMVDNELYGFESNVNNVSDPLTVSTEQVSTLEPEGDDSRL